MQVVLSSFLTSAAKSAWPILQPILMQVVRNLAVELIGRAKGVSLPPQLAFLAGPIVAVESDILKLVGSDPASPVAPIKAS